MKLSILICSLNSRIDMRKAMLIGLTASMGEFKHEVQEFQNYTIEKFINHNTEVIICTDNKVMTVGDKRNLLIQIASGDRIAFVDDDDRLESNYRRELIDAIKSDADVITFYVSVSLDGKPAKLCYYSKDYRGDYNEPDAYYRLPNHLMCVKRELALQVPFVSINSGEDSDYSRRLKSLLKSEYNINKILYHYDFNSQTTETQK